MPLVCLFFGYEHYINLNTTHAHMSLPRFEPRHLIPIGYGYYLLG